MYKSQRRSHTHLQFAQANASTKNCKRVCLANAQEEMKIVEDLKEKYMEMKECQCLTTPMRNAGKTLSISIMTTIRDYGKLEVKSIKILPSA